MALRVGYVGPWEDGGGLAGDYSGDRADPGRTDVGALRLRLIGVKNLAPAELPSLTASNGKAHPSVVLDLDYTVFMPRKSRQ